MKNAIVLLPLLASALVLTACCGCPGKMSMGKNSPSAATTAMAPMAKNCATAKVSGMTCEVCATTVSENLKKLPGVKDVVVSLSEGSVKIYHDGGPIDDAAVKHIVERSGYNFQSMAQSCK